MWTFIKRIFTWWNGATFGTLLQVSRKGNKVGSDEWGHTYYEERGEGYDGRKRRWVTYKGYADASRVPPEWHGWMHHTYDEAPTDVPLFRKEWEADHQANHTGSADAYAPSGSLRSPEQRPRVTGDYEAWAP